jgi:hypothetical protein
MWNAVHKDASPAERDRLRRWLESSRITVQELAVPDRSVCGELLRLDCPVTGPEKRSFAETAFAMGTSESALMRALVRESLLHHVTRLVDLVSGAGLDWSATSVPRRPYQRVFAMVAPYERRQFVAACRASQTPVGQATRAIVLVFLARWGVA